MAKRPRRPGRPGSADRLPDDETIMTKGLEAFAERGFDGVSVRDLGRALGVSHNFINDRYGNKEAFWRAVVDHSLRELQGAFEAALHNHSLDDLEHLRGVVRHIAGFTGPRPLLQQMLNFEAAKSSSRLLYIFERYIQPFTLALTPVIARLVRDGVLRPVPWHVLFFLFTAPRTASASQPLADLLGRPKGSNEADTAVLFADLIIDGLRVRGGEPSSSTGGQAEGRSPQKH